MNINNNEDAAVEHRTVAMCGTFVAVEDLDRERGRLAAGAAEGQAGFSRPGLCGL